MTGDRIVSSHFPYLPLHLSIHGHEIVLEALLDTGFDGAVIVPVGLVSDAQPPDTQLRWILADGSQVVAPTYRGTVRVGSFTTVRALVSALGDEPIVGLALANRFLITLDHGRQLVLEP